MFLLKRKHPVLTIAEKAMLRAKQMDARALFAAANLLLLLLILYTSHRFPNKFVRVTGECDTNWLRLGHGETVAASEIVCCDGTNRAHPCHDGMSLAQVLASTNGAWVLPLTPLIFNYMALMLAETPTMARIRVLVRRGGLYLALMLFRTFVLYVGLNRIEHALLALFFGAASDQGCWYKDLRRNHKCAAHFDHSDHVVLLVSHYLAVMLFEWFALGVEIPATQWTASIKKTALQLWMAVVSGAAVYTLFFTVSFFHSPMENLVAVVIAQVGVMLPLFLITQDYFTTRSALRLRNFVLYAHCEDDKQE